MLRCRENDLAIILKGPFLGFTVTVGRFLGTTDGVDPDGRRGISENCWEVKGIKVPDVPVVACEDRHLQPIRGRGTDQTTTTKKEMRA